MEISIEEEFEKVCDSIISNIIEYLSDSVYVEKIDNFFYIKSYFCEKEKDKKEINIKINRSEFHLNISKKSNFTLMNLGGSSHAKKEMNFESGNFDIKISPNIFNKYQDWLLMKQKEFLLEKMKSLEKTLYKEFNIDKKLKRKYVNSIINEKEDL